MSSKPNDIVALEWLVPLIDKQLGTIHDVWQNVWEADYGVLAADFHALANVFSVANLAHFSHLAQAISQACTKLHSKDLAIDHLPKIQRAATLLGYQLHQYALPDPNQALILSLKTTYLKQLCGDTIAPITQSFGVLLPKLPTVSDDVVKQVSKVKWLDAVQALKVGSASNQALLMTLTAYAAHLAEDDQVQALWRLTALWLKSLAIAGEVSATDQALMTELAQLIQADAPVDALTLENLGIDVYASLLGVKSVVPEVEILQLFSSRGDDSHQAFFEQVLDKLERVLFGLSEGKLELPMLMRIQRQMAERGWSFYEGYISYLLSDIESSKEDVAQARWQLTVQLQDLYNIIDNAHQAIKEKIGKRTDYAELSDVGQRYRARFLVDSIKSAFDTYLRSRSVLVLPKAEVLDELKQTFERLGVDAAVTARLIAFFTKLQAMALTRIGQRFADEVVYALAALDEVVDRLADYVMDDTLMDKVLSHLEVADALMGQTVADDELVVLTAPKQTAVVRYDDTGEIIPVQAHPLPAPISTSAVNAHKTSQTNTQAATQTAAQTDTQLNGQAEQVTAEHEQTDSPNPAPSYSEAYLNAKAALKDDDFSHDDDIREIFIEEAGEVLESLHAQLPVWQADPQRLKALANVRRGFHTLKGSGRMVGAFKVGEMAWAVENMLNHVLDNSIKPSAVMANFVAAVVEKLPSLIDDFQQKQAPSYDVAAVALKAVNLVAGRDINEGVPDDFMADVQAETATPKATDEVLNTSNHAVLDDDTAEMLAQMALDDAPALSGGGEIELPDVLTPFMEAASQPIESTVGEVDEDVRMIFVEEAEEVLSKITPMFAAWQEMRANRALLTEIRRGFHTLKGSGRMVGAGLLGELGWSIENMLNRVLDDSVTMNAGMAALVSDVLAEFPRLILMFKHHADSYPMHVLLWIACGHAYSKGHGEAFDYRIYSHFAGQHGMQWSLDVDEAQVERLESKQRAGARPIVDVLSSIHEAGEMISNAKPSTPRDEEEEQLCEIFIEEARELLDGVRAFLHDNKDKQAVPVNDEIVRAFHTLRGSSGLPPLVVVSEVGALIEKSLQRLQQHEAIMGVTHLAALESSVQLIESHLLAYERHLAGGITDSDQEDKLEEERLELEHLLAEEQIGVYDDGFDITVLIEDIETLLDADITLDDTLQQANGDISAYADLMLADIEKLKGRTTVSSKFQRLLTTLSAAYQLLSDKPEEVKRTELIGDVLRCHDDLTGLFDAIAGSMSLRLSDAADMLDERVAQLRALYVDDTEDAADEALLAETALLIDEAVSDEAIDVDPDLLDIFLGEAQALDATMQETLKQWRHIPNESNLPKALLHHVQTIKGGAILAGIRGMSDLMHEAERAYDQLVAGRLPSTQGWLAVMADVQTILSLQIKTIQKHGRSFYAPTAVAMLKDYISDKEIADGARLALPAFAQSDQATDAPTARSVDDDLSSMGFEAYQAHSWHGKVPDEDILDIFLEEVGELVEGGAEDFQAFRSNNSDVAALQSLQRNLHTIKGGARMVSANGIADLAHEMETVYEDLGARRRPVTKRVMQLLLVCHDWIAQAVQLLVHGINPPTPTPLIHALMRFTANPDDLTEVPNVSLAAELEAVRLYEMRARAAAGYRDITAMPPMKGVFAQREEAFASNEMVRIPSALMERMINLTGEAAINRSRIDMSMASLAVSIEEMGTTIQRLADQLRRMDIELEAQILAQIDDKMLLDEGFDPLEMDQYSSLNQLSKSLSESASDLLDLKATLLEKTRDGENLLLQLSRTHTDIQDGLMNSRMVPFSRLTPRFQRIVRQVSAELGKQVELTIINGDDELDKAILERITSPLEHMLRNAIDHGIEHPAERDMLGKSKTGHISLEVVREGTEVLVHLSDDGAGINVEAVRKKAISQGLISANDETLTDLDIMQYIFNSGLTTTNAVTQISGRGVGMDVVRTEIRQLGGTVSVSSKRGQGSRFTMRVPLTVAVANTLVVRAADRQYAIPLVQIERIVQVDPKALVAYYRSSKNTFELDGVGHRLRYLNELLSGHNFTELLSANTSVPVIVIKNQTGQNLALQVDEIVGSRIEVVVKPLGRQLSHVAGISAATIMGDGSVMFILDLLALIRNAQARVAVVIDEAQSEKRPVIMVVDDSVTVRKVTSRFLEREGFDTVVAKDGVDAMEILQELTPDVMLLDIEMPRMDGFEVASQVRHNARLKDLPIIMITSRTGEKHREHALAIGVDDYMGKPFQETELLTRIQALTGRACWLGDGS